MMTEDDIRTLLRAAAEPDPAAAPIDRILAAGRRRTRRHRMAQGIGSAVAVGLVVVGVSWTVDRSPADPVTAATGGCAAVSTSRVLPAWARGGFGDPVVPNVVGDRGEIVAVLFGDLIQPPPPGRINKILWVVWDGAGEPLTITARRGPDDPSPITRTLPDGPGPSEFDVPAAGCWTFDLRWGAHHDTLVLPYLRGA